MAPHGDLLVIVTVTVRVTMRVTSKIGKMLVRTIAQCGPIRKSVSNINARTRSPLDNKLRKRELIYRY